MDPHDRRECVCRLALQRIFFQHPIIARTLLHEWKSAESIFSAPKAKLRPHFGLHETLWLAFDRFSAWNTCEHDLAFCEREKIVLLWEGKAEFPECLAELFAPPCLLMAWGADLSTLTSPAVAMVGSRKASEWGKRIAFDIARGLSQAGIVVVSGMAYGIDAAAHEGALAGSGATVAVWGSSLDRLYPPGHRELASRIAKRGMIVSEFPLGTAARPHYFPQRNRIVSGLALGVVVVEAGKASGSLITARLAAEQGREVFSVPGLAASLTTAGSNQLLRDGATLVESAEEVLMHLVPQLQTSVVKKTPGHCPKLPAKERGSVVPSVREFQSEGRSDRIVSLEEYALQSGRGVGEALTELSQLLLDGVIEEIPGRRYRWKE